MSKRRRQTSPMNAMERRAVFSLAGIFGLRIFGLFLILPVFAIYATDLENATPFLIGLTLGAYGLTQAMLQIPFGVLSDRWHRKKAIIIGLLIFALGSLIAGFADSIYGVLAGRLIQGAGAISAAVIALMADLTRESQRTKAMAIIGIGIGFIFMLSMMLGPIFEQWIGVNGIFLMTAVAAILAIPLLLIITPDPKRLTHIEGTQPIKTQIKEVLKNTQLRQLDFGIFALHAVLTAIFVIIPFVLIDLGGLAKTDHWKVYSSVMVLGVIGMLPFMKISHQPEKVLGAMRLAVFILCLGVLLMLLNVDANWWGLLIGLALFFVGFNTMEATLPSLVSRIAPLASKGTATGVYNSAQFFGVFIGGATGGWLSGAFGFQAVLWFCLFILTSWLLLTIFTKELKLHESKLINMGVKDAYELKQRANKLRAVAGVEEVFLVAGEAMAYLKVDPDLYNSEQVSKLTEQVKLS